jgi:hypothetical protein
MKRAAAALGALAAVLALGSAPAHAGDGDDTDADTGAGAGADAVDPLRIATVVFARDHSLWRIDAKGKGEPTEVVALGAPASDVRAIRTDTRGTVLLVDLAGAWSWMKLDGKTTALTPLPCKGAATLAPDASCVVCGNAKGQVAIINLASGKAFDIPVPAAGAALVGDAAARKLVWSDGGLWSAPPGAIGKKQAVAPESPLRSLSVAPDGSRALGVYQGEVHQSRKTTATAELLYQFALDGTAARRKSIRAGVPVMWSHDSAWVLIQDGARACIARAVGGEYKCWKGYTAVSIAPDGSWALVLGQRKTEATKGKGKSGTAKDKAGKDKAGKAKGKAAADAEAPEAEKPAGASAEGEAGGGGEGEGDAEPADDAAVPLPTGPLSLYRAQLSGAFADTPALVVREVDGAAVWLP